jgi:hypothetical protein
MLTRRRHHNGVRALAIVLVLGLAGCSGGSQQDAAGSSAPAIRAPVRSPAPISARLVPPARTMTAGSSMAGHVVIENNTGHAIHAFGCLTLFQVALVSGTYHPAIAWLDCLQPFTIPAGHSTYPVSVAASYSQCSQGRPSSAMKVCLPDGHPPPLPAGVYRAVLFQARHTFAAPPAIKVRVTTRTGPLRPPVSSAESAISCLGPAQRAVANCRCRGILHGPAGSGRSARHGGSRAEGEPGPATRNRVRDLQNGLAS